MVSSMEAPTSRWLRETPESSPKARQLPAVPEVPVVPVVLVAVPVVPPVEVPPVPVLEPVEWPVDPAPLVVVDVVVPVDAVVDVVEVAVLEPELPAPVEPLDEQAERHSRAQRAGRRRMNAPALARTPGFSGPTDPVVEDGRRRAARVR